MNKDLNSFPCIDGEFRQIVREKYTALKKYRENRSVICKQKLRSLSQGIKTLKENIANTCKELRVYLTKTQISFGAAIRLSYGTKNNTAQRLLTRTLRSKTINSFFTSTFVPSQSTIHSSLDLYNSNMQISDITLTR